MSLTISRGLIFIYWSKHEVTSIYIDPGNETTRMWRESGFNYRALANQCKLPRQSFDLVLHPCGDDPAFVHPVIPGNHVHHRLPCLTYNVMLMSCYRAGKQNVTLQGTIN